MPFDFRGGDHRGAARSQRCRKILLQATEQPTADPDVIRGCGVDGDTRRRWGVDRGHEIVVDQRGNVPKVAVTTPVSR
jgi:hypothetical protein